MVSYDKAFLKFCFAEACAIDESLAACARKPEELRWWTRDGLDRDRLAKVLGDPETARMLRSVARRAMCKVLFHLVVALDEGREVSESGVSMRLVYEEGGTLHRASSELHERLGDVMIEQGVDFPDWWP